MDKIPTSSLRVTKPVHKRMKDIEIVPSLLSANFARLEDDLTIIEQAGCTSVHIDVMDGHFVPNITIGPVVLTSIRKVTNLYFQTHLMIEKPEKFIEAFVKAGSDCITVHEEACFDAISLLRDIRRFGIHAGISIKPKTPPHSIQHLLDEIDHVLVMSVEPGFGGQSYIRGSEEKIAVLRGLIDRMGLSVTIGVDGGINVDTIGLAAASGANHLIAGSAVFNGDIAANIQALKDAAMPKNEQGKPPGPTA